MSLEYVELSKTKKGYFGDTCTKWLVRPKWSLTFTFTFFDVTIRFTVPLMRVLATFLSPAAAGVVRLLRIRADLVVSLQVSMSIDVAFGRDEYGYATGTGGSCALVFTFSVALKMSVANINLMTLSASVPVTIRANFRLGRKPEVWVTSQLTGSLHLNLTATFFEGSRWFQRGPYTYTPEWSKVRYAGSVVPLLVVK